MDDVTVSNVFLNQPVKEKIATWIIITSVIAGILLLLLIILGLIKVNTSHLIYELTRDEIIV